MYRARILANLVLVVFVALAVAAEFGHGWFPSKALVVAAGLATAFLATRRTTWLPFLGPAAMPVGVFKTSMPEDADFTMTLSAPACAVKVVYWGAVTRAKDPVVAYGGYANSGVADVQNGQATISLKKPKAYSVFGRQLAPHVHYRWITTRGLLSSVRTARIDS